MNVDTGEIRRWDSLTPEEQQSGEWIKLPPHDENGIALARPKPGRGQHTPSALEQFFKDLDVKREDMKRRFDAVGKRSDERPTG